jgi:hypothetical protein
MGGSRLVGKLRENPTCRGRGKGSVNSEGEGSAGSEGV